MTMHKIPNQVYHATEKAKKTAIKWWFRTANVTEESLASDVRVRQVGLAYSVYRFIIATFLLLASYAISKSQQLGEPTLTEAIIIGSYLAISLVLLGLFYLVPQHARRQLLFGFIIDILALAFYSINSPISSVQLALLYMITISASFMLLTLSRATFVMFFGMTTVIYQNLFHANTVTNTHDGWLLAFCLLAVGFLSWSISQRLSAAELSIIAKAKEVDKLNLLNRTVVKNMVNGVLVLDQNRNLIMLNKSAEELLNLPFDADFCDTPVALTEVARYLVKEHTPLIEWYHSIDPNVPSSLTYRLKPNHRNLSDTLRINSKPLGSAGQLLIIEDINREQSHAQMLKLASLGELSASIAHEIRNPLGAISQASQLLMEDAKEDDENLELYKMIVNQTKRVNNIISDVLSLSRQEIPNQKAIRIQPWLHDFLEQHYSNQSIAIITPFHCPDDNMILYFDANHLEQIMINLINNALRHTVHLPNQADVQIRLSLTGNTVFVDVVDNGEGVAEEDIPMLFNPFFTTSKKGTGLGLYLSQSFSEANNARIRYLRLDQKSCFRLIASNHPMT